jgi:hypothetical protein
MYICCHCYMFRLHMGHHQATLVVGRPLHCTLVLVPIGTLLLLLLLVFFIGCFHPTFLVCCSLRLCISAVCSMYSNITRQDSLRTFSCCDVMVKKFQRMAVLLGSGHKVCLQLCPYLQAPSI